MKQQIEETLDEREDTHVNVGKERQQVDDSAELSRGKAPTRG